jgi:hypothetical protein
MFFTAPTASNIFIDIVGFTQWCGSLQVSQVMTIWKWFV